MQKPLDHWSALAWLPLVFALAAHTAAADDLPSLRFHPSYACRPPVMPIAALRHGTTGRSVLGFSVDEHGALGDFHVLQSAGVSREHKGLDRAAIDHLRSCRYQGPDPKPAPGRYQTVLTWQIE